METIDERRFFTMAEAYDRMCGHLVPQYGFLQDEVLGLIPIDHDRDPVFVDLGAGSGILLEKVLMRWPRAMCFWVDYSTDFYEVAQRRLDGFDSQVQYILSPIEASWESQIPGKVDVILSMSAIHHLEEAEKRTLYGRCWDKLRCGGWFYNIDEMKTSYRDAYVASMRFWVDHVERAGDQLEPELAPFYAKWKAHFDNWKARNIDRIDAPKAKGDDLHEDFSRQVNWLRECGFTHTDVFLKYHLWCAIGGRKSADGGGSR